METAIHTVISPVITRTMIEASHNPPSIFDRTIIIATLFNSLLTYNRNVARLLEERHIFAPGTEFRLDTLASNILVEPKNLQHQVDGYNFLRGLKEPFAKASQLLAFGEIRIPEEERTEGLHTSMTSFAFLKTFEGVCFPKDEPFLTNPYKADPFVTLHTAAAMLHHVCRTAEEKIRRPIAYTRRHEPLNNAALFRQQIEKIIPVSLNSDEANPRSLHQTCRALHLLSENLACFIQDAREEPRMEIPNAALETFTTLRRYVEPYELADHAPARVVRSVSGTVIDMNEAAERLHKKSPALQQYDM